MFEPTCLIFDLFGTLVDYEPVRTNLPYEHSYRLANVDCSYEEFAAIWEDCFSSQEQLSIETGREFHMHAVSSHVCQQLGKDTDQAPDLAAAFIEDWQQGITPVTGVTGLLTRLAKHYRLALITNTHYPPMVNKLLQDMQLVALFEHVAMSVEVGVPKPYREIFEKTMESMGVSGAEAVYIGDNYDADYVGAKNVGMDCFLIGRHARVPRDRQLRSIMDMPIHFKTEKQ